MGNTSNTSNGYWEDGTPEHFYWREVLLDWRRGYYDSEEWPAVAAGLLPWEVATTRARNERRTIHLIVREYTR